MKFHLILTLDYELFGNGTGCIDKCIVEPVDRLLDILEPFDCHCTFFVDALEFIAIRREAGAPQFTSVGRLEEQLRQINAGKHSLQLHLHPQWLDARWGGDEWLLNHQFWRIGDMPRDRIDEAVLKGMAYLQEFTDRPVTTFRAGGWAIQPGREALDSLKENGILVDTTVAPGARNPAKGDWFDFRRCPDKPFWKIDNDPCSEDAKGRLLEVPIATARIGRVRHIKALKEHRSSPEFPPGCNGTYDGPNGKVQGLLGKIGKARHIGHVMLDFSTLPAWTLIAATEDYMRRFSHHPAPVPIVAIGHNKNYSTSSENHMKDYLDWAAEHADIIFSDFGRWQSDLSARAVTGTGSPE